ncbi:mannose-1-phosphate guanylyltransferase [Enterobacter hormaechei subsp. steigerwaltii]|uniref:mannose-1-phosphate guanylyltransferase/mannose-6-phosphate isomerase n=1 Tax=Enterobacter hormaechei TaxID=158836 RepID=UPI0005EFD39C|nr:mannose-1-phosphate guanylyltransferase/mannose-6-phosphate isomerase [Enterobacter hormaechei]OOK63018.1 mannose-1-phosphate guanylyltransferase/mannose-6-phosphate isomerase [Pedobacter himalayensis]ELC6537296.1 mannose-1-phosphate guanylyltransferase/mannose-6-phosphate isomerase [Enterobacter hormaechei]EMD5646441.1 mannose-1-phosphate guanylyltransferase/mannose-6-phosphate isomerase [Enterobacter hormaechei]KJL75864.1 mannose-1-phosphate guanylyltransferase [Enterobacter hormaechei sub
MKDNVTAVILAGGVGSRLWPLSREENPKQFISIDGENSLLSNTLLRLPSLGIKKVIVVCNFAHRFLVAETLRKYNLLSNNIILEPCGKNTAAAIALAAFHIEKNCGQKEKMLVLAADHVIEDCDAFAKSFNDGCLPAELGKLVTFGIVPNYPETGYGYIEIGNNIYKNSFEINQFVEKPPLELAREYLNSGKFLWNSGMFLFGVQEYLSELTKFRDDIYSNCYMAYNNSTQDDSFVRIPADIFESCPSESIDYAIMEKSTSRVVVPLCAGWNDVGSWDSIWDLSLKNCDGNSLRGDVLALETKNSYVRAESKLVATYGVSDLIVVDTDDALLITTRANSQNVKKIFDTLKSKSREECTRNRSELRYWGGVQNVHSSNDYKINILTIEPFKEISYQQHNHRIECWYILKGKAIITMDDISLEYNSNDSILIRPGCKHKIKNDTNESLVVVEIQDGLIKDDVDITRYNK